MTVKCPECGTRLKSDYQFCNECGYRLLNGHQVCLRPVPKKVTTSVPSHHIVDKRRASEPGISISRRNLVTSILALLAMVPFTPWISTFDGTLCFYAAMNDALYGQYITYLAIAGLLMAYSERFIPDLTMRRLGLAGIGFGILSIIVIDYLQIWEAQSDSMTSWTMTEPGLGMYMGAAISIALIVVALLPCKDVARTVRPSTVRIIRPGSPGSGP